MKELTIDARECLDGYLLKVRARMTGAKALDGAEVERDIYEYIEKELEDVDEPVDRIHVEQVLQRLGAPEQWVPDEDLSWWGKIITRMKDGPDDWRLAYICFGLFALGLIILPIGIFILIPLSFYIARSAICLAGGIKKLQNQKILIYPSLVFFYVLTGMVVLFWPLVILGGLNDDVWWFVVAGLGLWWILLGGFFLAKYAVIDKLVYPFGSLVSMKRLRWLIFWGAGMLLLGMAMGILVYNIS